MYCFKVQQVYAVTFFHEEIIILLYLEFMKYLEGFNFNEYSESNSPMKNMVRYFSRY